MGPYQWHLFALCGGGWMADNLWLQVRSLGVANENFIDVIGIGCRVDLAATFGRVWRQRN